MLIGDNVDCVAFMYGYSGLSGQIEPNLQAGKTTNPATWRGLKLMVEVGTTPV